MKRGRKQSSKENSRREHKNVTSISAGLWDRVKTVVKRGCEKCATERRGGKGVRLAVCPTVRGLNGRLAGKQETTGELKLFFFPSAGGFKKKKKKTGVLVKRQQQNTHKITDRLKRENTDTTTTPAPLTTETSAKTEVDHGDVSKSVELAKSAPRDSSTLCTISRMRELSLCICRHHEPRTAPRAVVYRAEESVSLTGPGS